MKRLAPLVALVLLAAFPLTVSAAVYDDPYNGNTMHCVDEISTANDPAACLGEHSVSGWPSGDLLLLTNGSDITDFNWQTHGPSGNCDERSIIIDLDNMWNDCVTDGMVILPFGWCFRSYTDNNYHGERIFSASNNVTAGTKTYHFASATGSLNNAMSSARLYTC